jgi:hypothetical protein
MLTIGTTRRGKPLMLTDKERARHIHVMGGIGTGKSKLLEHMIRQDIVRRRGLCLLDPHGALAEPVEKWCAMYGLGRIRRVHLIKPGDNEFVPGFNPLRSVAGEDPSVRVDAMVGACAQAWGVSDMSETPRLEKILRALFFALQVRGLTLAEGPQLLRAGDPEGVRHALTNGLPDPIYQNIWNELNSLSRKDFAEHVESTHTRLTKFLASPAMRLVVGQSAHAIDFRSAMDNGEIVLVNLGAQSAFSYENARVLGTLLINDLFLTALRRDEKTAQRKPFTLYVDEAYDFLSGDIEKILDQTRKFGLHAVLAHQRVGQLKARGEGVFNAVMAGTQTKIVLGGLADEDAEIMAKEIMRGDVDLTKPKPGITAPVVVGEEPFWLESESSSEGRSTTRSHTETYSTSEGVGSSTGVSDSFSQVDGQSPEQRGRALCSGQSSSSVTTTGYSNSNGVTDSYSSSHGRSQTLRSIREERPTHFYSLEESFHLAMLKIRNLPDRSAIVKRRGTRTIRIETIDVKPVLDVPRAVERFRTMARDKSPYVAPMSAVQAELDARRDRLRETPTQGESSDQEFWTEE